MARLIKIFILLTLVPLFSFAQEETDETTPTITYPAGYLRKLVVFPMDISKGYEKPAEDSWWKVRETLTDTKRFLVASKRFLIQKDVMQPRSKLSASDGILLGQLLESDGLVLMSLKNRQLTMTVYTCVDGSVLWTGSLALHASLPIEKQTEDSAVKLIRDFIATVPYHGLQILDPLIGRPVYEEGDVRLSKVDVGSNTRAAVGDSVQWINIEKTTNAPLFLTGSRSNVIAEGEIVKNENGILLVELKRLKDVNLLTTNSLVRLPKEAEFLNANYALQTSRNLAPELRYSPLPPARPANEETKPLVAALVAIANFVGFLLLAF